MTHPDFAHIGDPATNLIEECAELIQALTKLQRFGVGMAPYDNRAQVIAEIADVRNRITEWDIANAALATPTHQAAEPLIDFARRVSAQEPEMTNYLGGTCGQCERNIESAEDALQDSQHKTPVEMGSLLQRLMARLADLLDDDKFNDIQGMVEAAGYTYPLHQAAEPAPSEPNASPVNWLLDLMGEFDFTMPVGAFDRFVAHFAASPAPLAEGVPDGWVMAPREPTEAMADAAVRAYQAWFAAEKPWSTFEHSDSYRAMIAAAPPAPTPALPDEVAKYDYVLIPFLAMMRAELHANASKGDRPGWLTMDRDTAMLEVYHHAAKLAKALRNDNVLLICEHAADVANMAMMVVDICGALTVDAAIAAQASQEANS